MATSQKNKTEKRLLIPFTQNKWARSTRVEQSMYSLEKLSSEDPILTKPMK
jgi:hypothetical protein